MKIKNILVSQPAPAVIEKSPYNELISKYHIHAQFHPFIKVEGVSLKEFRSQRIEILDHTAVIFTSRTTIDSFFRICEEARITVPEGMKYFCNTEAVALYLQKYIVYRKRKIFFANGTFANFMELLNKHKEENFLLTVSEPHKPEMPVAMEKHHLKFDKVVFARTVSADLSGVNVNDYDMLVFYSPSEITSLINAFPEIGAKTKIATFGHNTTQAALNSGLVVSVMAPSPEAPSMTKALELYAKKVNAGEEVEPITLDGQSPGQAYIQAQDAKAVKRKPAAKNSTTKSGSTTKSATTKSTTLKTATTAPVKKSRVSTPSK